MALGLAFAVAPRLVAAAVVVAEPTGDADPALLAELKTSLEAVVSEMAPDFDAEMRSSAANGDAGLELVVELVPGEGKEPIRETRIVSRASAMPQARAMGRGAIRTLVAETAPGVAIAQQKSVAPPLPPLHEMYSRHKALVMTIVPTVLLPLVGAGILSLGFLAVDSNEAVFWACVVSGSTIAAGGLIFGPTFGYFWVGRWRHALAMSGLRLALLGTGVTSLFFTIVGSMCDYDENCGANPMWALLSATSLTASLLTGIIDASFVGHAADRANERYRRSLQVTVAPVAWTNGSGERTFGLALNGSF